MSIRTFKDYNKAILAQYAIARKGVYAGYLNEPTPASLKSLALICFDNSSNADYKIFQNFFQFNSEKDKRKQIQNFDVDAFRPLCNFIKQKNSPRRNEGVDLVAVLVNFEGRPLSKFLKQDVAPSNLVETKSIDNTLDHYNETNTKHILQEVIFYSQKNINKFIIYISIIIGIIISNLLLYEDKGCMVWIKNHYEEVDCDAKNIQSLFNLPIIPLDKETCKYFKKVQVSDTTTFFNPDGSARIWYGKSASKEYEYFTCPGIHPETKKTLKEITPYIIRKHIKSSEN